MPRQGPLAVILSALALVAGCMDPDSVEESLDAGVLREPTDTLQDAVAALAPGEPVGIPTWSKGDWWEFESSNGDRNTYVVTSTDGDSYRLDVTSESTAFYDAAFDISFVGPIAKTDFSGKQGSTPVRFFKWPLEDGASWTTTWDGLDVTLTASVVPAVRAPLGTGPGYSIVGLAGDDVHVQYTYSPLVKWWTTVRFGATGEWGHDLVSQGTNFTGILHRGEATTHVESILMHGAVILESFTVAADATHLAVERKFDASGLLAVRLVDPDGAIHELPPDLCPCVDGMPTQLPVKPGEWRLHATFLGDLETQGELLVIEATIQEFAFP